MSNGPAEQGDPRIDQALEELRVLIRGQWPSATFAVTRGEDPEGIYLETTVDVEDGDEVMDLVVERLLDMQVQERLPVYILVLRPLERALAQLTAVAATGRR